MRYLFRKLCPASKGRARKKLFLSVGLAGVLAAVSGCHDGFEPEAPVTRAGLLPVAGAFNVRDLGQSGITGEGGRAINPGLIIRSGEINMLSPRDVEFLFGESGMGIRYVVDFRSTRSPVNFVNTEFGFAPPPAVHNNPAGIVFTLGRSERENAPSRVPAHVTVWDRDNARPSTAINDYEIVMDYFVVIEDPDAYPTPQHVVDAMAVRYGNFIWDTSLTPDAPNPAARRAFGSFFEAILHANGQPLLFHCSAGKDRTGMAAMLLLMALGVERQAIVDDFTASREFVQARFHPVVPFIEQDVARNMLLQRDQQAPQILGLLPVPDVGGGISGTAMATAILTHSQTPGFLADIIEDRVNNHGDTLAAARTHALGNIPASGINAAAASALTGMQSLVAMTDQQIATFAHEGAAKIRPLLSVYPEWIIAAMDAVGAAGGIEAYLTTHLGLPADTVTRLRTIFLQGYGG